jgi:hypothetical protein
MSKTILKVSLVLLGMFISFGLLAQKMDESDTRSMMEANFLYQFANNNQWPSSMKKGNFKIVIVGNEAVYNHFVSKYKNQTIGLQPIEVVQTSNAQSIPVNTHLVFVDKTKKSDWNQIQKLLKEKSTLMVSNWEGALSSGAHINFKSVNGSIRYELNEVAMNEDQIQPGIKIMQWRVYQYQWLVLVGQIADQYEYRAHQELV